MGFYMHEMGVIKDVLETALSVAEKNDGKKITGIKLRAGIMSGLIPHYCKTMFEFVAKDTIAQDCRLEIEEEPAVFECLDCSKRSVYKALSPEYKCHFCKSSSLRLIEGHKSQIVSVAIV